MERQKTGKLRRIGGLILLAMLAVVLIYNAFYALSYYAVGPNYRNVSIDTRVNINQSKSDVISVIVDGPVTLNAGSTIVVECNATIRDYNGFADITNVSAMLWDNRTQTVVSPNDNNDHYTNASCSQRVDYGLYYSNFTCNFTVWYYANNGTQWVCNVTATDDYNFNESVNRSTWLTNTTTFNTLLALNVTSLVDYGDMAVGDTTLAAFAPQTNITNFGNTNINISVLGYGDVSNDGLAFKCDFGNISIANEKYSLVQGDDFLTQYTALGSAFQSVVGLTLPQQMNDSLQVVNSTYWRLYVPPNPFGQCNGTIVFQAELSQ